MKSALRWGLAATAAILLGLAVAQPAYADNPKPGLTPAIPGLPGGLLGSGALDNVPKLANGLPKLSPELLSNPAGSAGGTDKRDFGTPTKAADKVCPFTGNVPVSIPLVNSPAGTSLPGLGGYTLSQPAIPGSIYSELCMSNETLAAARQGRPPAVLVLVHGITYGTWYWDSPYQPAKYSIVNGLIKHPRERQALEPHLGDIAVVLDDMAADPGARAARQRAADQVLNVAAAVTGSHLEDQASGRDAVAAMRMVATDVLAFVGVERQRAQTAEDLVG